MIVPTQWGVFGEAVVIIGVVDSLRELNLGQWATSSQSDRCWKDLPGALVTTTIVAFLGLVAIMPWLGRLSPDLPLTTAVLAVSLIPRTWTLGAEAQLNTRQRLHRLLVPQLIGAVAFLVTALLISARFRTAWALSVATVTQVGVYCALLLGSNHRELDLRPRFDHIWQSLWSARDFIALALAGVAFIQVDGLLVGFVAGPTAAGYYIMAGWLVTRLPAFVETPLLRVLLPVFVQRRDEPAKLGELFNRATMAINYLEVPWCFLLMFNASFVVRIVLGPSWSAAVPLVVLVAVYPVLSPIGTVGWEVLRMTGKTRVVLAGLLASSCVFVLAALVLGLRFGVLGVVLASYLSLIVNWAVLFVLPQLIGWRALRDVMRQVGILYVGCGLALALVGVVGLRPAVVFAVDSTLMLVAALVGLRPLIPLIAEALTTRRTDKASSSRSAVLGSGSAATIS